MTSTKLIKHDQMKKDIDRWSKEIAKLNDIAGDINSNDARNKIAQLSQLLADSYNNEFRRGYYERAMTALGRVLVQIKVRDPMSKEEQQKQRDNLKKLMHDNVDKSWSDAASSGYEQSQEDADYAKWVNRYTDDILKRVLKYFAGSLASIAVAGDIGAGAGFVLGKAGIIHGISFTVGKCSICMSGVVLRAATGGIAAGIIGVLIACYIDHKYWIK